MIFKNPFLKIGSKIKSIKRSKLALLALAVLASVSLLSVPAQLAQKATADSNSGAPRFNFLSGDQEMLQVAKTTDTAWSDPISANPGDRVAFLLYYHNGTLNSTAHNVTVSVDLPLVESNQLVAKSWLSSDETAPITDTIVDGQIVGLSGATINLPTNSSIEYVPGSTRLFPNNSQTGTVMPDGITTTGGLNIGSINGCWPYAGFVTFLADIKSPAQLSIDKSVAHPGESDWHKEISANPGDSVAYHLSIENNGGQTAGNVTITDKLPDHMTYESGTTYIYTKENPDGVKAPDTIFSSGISLPDLTPGQDGMVYVTYRTQVVNVIPAGSFNLVNLAEVFMSGQKQGEDRATVKVSAERGLVIDKKVSNGVSWVNENRASLLDTLDYRIIVRNTGNITLNNVFVRDVLPVFVNYLPGSTMLDGHAVSDDIVTSAGLSLGSLAPGQERVITLSGKIYGCPPIGGYKLINTASVRANDVTETSASAQTLISLTSPSTPKVNN